MQLDRIDERPIGSADGTLLVAEWTLPPPVEDAGPMAISPPLTYPYDDLAWYVVEGRLRVTLGDETVIVGAGGAAIANAGTPHTLGNAGPGPCRYVIIAHRASRRSRPRQWLQRARRPRRIATVPRSDAARLAAELAAQSDAARRVAEPAARHPRQ